MIQKEIKSLQFNSAASHTFKMSLSFKNPLKQIFLNCLHVLVNSSSKEPTLSYRLGSFECLIHHFNRTNPISTPPYSAIPSSFSESINHTQKPNRIHNINIIESMPIDKQIVIASQLKICRARRQSATHYGRCAHISCPTSSNLKALAWHRLI